MTVLLFPHTKLEIVGLSYKDNGRSCGDHPNGCGASLRVGDIVKLSCKETQFEEEHLKLTKKQEYRALTVDALKEILKDEYLQKGMSGKNKEWLVDKLLLLRNEPNNDLELTEVKRWTEWAVEVYKAGTDDCRCKVGFISRNFVNIYPELTLDGIFGKVLRLRGQSEFKAERAESCRMGGVALIETVTLEFR
jgi:hypothetical protein